MNLVQALRLPRLTRLAAVGAGGKTSLLFQAGREMLEASDAPLSLLLTTTTHLAGWQAALADQQVIVDSVAQLTHWGRHIPSGLLVVSGPETADQRLSGLNEALLAKLLELADEHELPLLIEADGARLKPLKAPAGHEPAIPSFASQVVVCAGLSSLGKPLSDEWVHRPERFGELAGLGLGQAVTRHSLQRVLAHPQGGLKHIPVGARRSLLLTQADSPALQAEAHALAESLLPYFDSVLTSRRLSEDAPATRTQIEPLDVQEPTAGVVLAAGGASRFGRAKQLLDWHGKPFVRQVAETALQAGLSPVLVVVGAYADEVSRAVAGLPVQLVMNSTWQQGHSTSVVRAVQALPENIGAAVFLLSDQPQAPFRLVRSLVEMHQVTLAPVVAPLVDGQRGNPVLFDRDTFAELARLRFDQGGRQLFSRFAVKWLPWHDPSVLLDVDTEEDYRRLIEASQARPE